MNITCEGALAFLNDTVYPPDACKLRLSLFLDKVIANHNEKCNENRKVHIGSVTMDDVEIQYNGSYTNTMELIRSLHDTYGGYIITHYSEGGNYFDWLKEIPLELKETINVEQVVDISKAISAEDVVTCVIPMGKDGLTIGSEYIENEAAAALFGKVWQCVEFGDIEDSNELYNSGLDYLNNNLWSSMQLEISALDVGDNYQVGRMYHARIPSFNINHDIVLMGATISLVDDSATKYSFSATTIWTQINNGKDLAQVVDTAQALKMTSHKSLTSRTAKMEEFIEKASYFSGDIIFSDGTKITCVNGLVTGGKSTEGDF
ncbi:MAG: phage tail protein [Lachnospiraceae bacterium]|nr:phage tail protein [Lachnospiraceae bacterium]